MKYTEANSAPGPGTRDGTSVTERDTSMAERGRRRKWTNHELNHVKYLTKCNSASEIGEILGITKNAVIGALYRDKIRNGYVPPEDSKYTGPKNL